MRRNIAIVFASMVALWISVAPIQAATDPASADAAVADRLVEMARHTLRSEAVTDATWHSAQSLFQAAVRLRPDEPRYLRLLLETQLHTNDSSGAIDTARKLLTLDPADQSVQLQLIELYLSQMQTVDAQANYLRDLLDKTAIDPEVRSRLAMRLARLMMEQSQLDPATKAVDQALELDPLNFQALQWRYQQNLDAQPLARVSILLELLKSNPAHPELMSALAGELAQVGLVRESVSWYAQAFSLSGRMGIAISSQTAADYASELLLADRVGEAGRLIEQMLKADDSDPVAWMLRLVAEKNSWDTVAAVSTLTDGQSLTKARQALDKRLQQVAQQLVKQAATTQPNISTQSDAPAPSSQPSADVLRSAPVPLADAYRSALTDLAWFEIYFAQKPQDALPLIDQLKAISPDDSVSVTRLEGWAYLVQGKLAEARTKLQPVEDRDPLAALGMLRPTGSDGQTASGLTGEVLRVQRQELMTANPSGLVGVIIHRELSSQAVTPVLASGADAVSEKLKSFDENWLQILDRPERFYTLRAEPLQVAHKYGEPMLARVTLANLSDYPLTIGDQGILRPDLWIDASVRGITQQQFPGTAFDRLAKRLVLKPKERITQIVQIDQGNLADFFAANPGISIQVFATIMTNPTTNQQGVLSGVAGYSSRFSRMMERSGYPFNSGVDKDRLVEQATTGDSAARIRSLQLAATYIQILSHQPQTDTNAASVAGDLREALTQATRASSTAVQAWGRYLDAMIAQPAAQQTVIQQMQNSGDWIQQLLSLVAAHALPVEVQKQMFTAAEKSSDPVVRAYAQAGSALLADTAAAAATQPTTAP